MHEQNGEGGRVYASEVQTGQNLIRHQAIEPVDIDDAHGPAGREEILRERRPYWAGTLMKIGAKTCGASLTW